MNEKLGYLEELPEFFTYPEKLFGSRNELPIYEIARLTYRQNHSATPPHREQEVVQVIGRSVDQTPSFRRGGKKFRRGGKKEYTLFCALKSITRLDGTTIAVNSTGKGVKSVDLDAYEVLRSHEDLYGQHNTREAQSFATTND